MEQSNQGVLGRLQGWMTPERSIALMGIGQGLSQLAAGQPANLSHAHAALMHRQQSAQQRRILQESGILDQFSPDQQALLATMEPSAAQRIIAQAMFAPPPDPVRGINIGGRLVNPETGAVMADFSTPDNRRIIQGADGFNYYSDTGERVLPGIEAQQDFRPATPEEAASYGAQAGQFGPDGRFYANNPPRGQTIEVSPDGTMRLTEGPGVGVGSGQLDFQSPTAMIRSIDAILEDPALDTSTGILSPLQSVPGTPQYRFGTRADQLSGQAFLQAYESLRGAGQITEFESQQASRAVGRLDTAQRPEDYRAALQELRELLVVAQARPEGWADGQTPSPSGASSLSEEALRFLEGN